MDKVCGICGEDCGDRPRVKDAKGRYFCKACAMDKVAQPETPTAPAVSGDDDGDPYTLDEADPGAAPLPIEMLDYADQGTQCPGCLRTMPAGAKVCVSCGYNVEKGIQSSTKIEKRKGRSGRGYLCDTCGYDLTGLRASICPECGSRINLSAKKRLQTNIERDVLVAEWRKPAIWFAIGFLGMAIEFARWREPEMIVIYGGLLAVQVLVGYAVLWLCFTFLGDIGTPLLNLARLAGIYVLVDLVGLYAMFIPFCIFYVPLIIKLVAYIWLFCNAFDTDWQQSLLVIALTWLAKMAILLAVYFFLPDLLIGF